MPTLRRRLTRTAPPRPDRLFVEVTCADDGFTHRVDEATYAADMTAGHGCYRAACGRTVLAASLAMAPGRRCPTCRQATLPERAQGSSR